jgi:hypothetical protein
VGSIIRIQFSRVIECVRTTENSVSPAEIYQYFSYFRLNSQKPVETIGAGALRAGDAAAFRVRPRSVPLLQGLIHVLGES